MLVDQNGMETVHFWRNDWLKLARIRSLGLKKLIISTEVNLAISVRAKSLKSECIQEVEYRALIIADWATSLGLSVPNKIFHFLHIEKLT
jgi:hypothetical protein